MAKKIVVTKLFLNMCLKIYRGMRDGLMMYVDQMKCKDYNKKNIKTSMDI